MKRPLIFDVDGVLVHGYHAKPEFQIRWDETIDVDLGIDRQHFSDSFFAKDFSTNVIVGKKDLKGALAAWLATTDYRVSPEQIIAYWMSRDSNINNELLFCIIQIRENRSTEDGGRPHPAFVATNQEHHRARHLWETCGFKNYFDDMFYSARLGVVKPDTLYFQRVAEQVDFAGVQPLFFDDRIEVVEEARRHGWEAVEYETIDDFRGHPYIRELIDNNI